MILTRKRLLADIFLTHRIIKITRILRVCERYFRALYQNKVPRASLVSIHRPGQ